MPQSLRLWIMEVTPVRLPIQPSTWNPIAWLRVRVPFYPVTSAEFLYDNMESQSGWSLPLFYVPFDSRKRAHFVDRGQILDYAINTGAGRVLDFGPGDGWPALLLSPFVEEVVGVDGSRKRVETCRANAKRLGISNATFVYVEPGQPLPFAACEFDGVTAASSVEQSPNAKATLTELFRVLKPGGRLRMHYESLHYYLGNAEGEWELTTLGAKTHVVIYDRHVEEGLVHHYGLVLALPMDDAVKALGIPSDCEKNGILPTPKSLMSILPYIEKAVTWTTIHPSCNTLLQWLREIGFSAAYATHNGGTCADRLFDRLAVNDWPNGLDQVDALLRPLVAITTELEAPCVSRRGVWDPWVTTIK